MDTQTIQTWLRPDHPESAICQIEESHESAWTRGQLDSPGLGALVARRYTMVTTTAVTFSAVLGDRWSMHAVMRGPLGLLALHMGLLRLATSWRPLEYVAAHGPAFG